MASPEMIEAQRAGLRTWLVNQRWYGDKSRTLTHVAIDPLMTVEIDVGPVTVMLVSCSFADGSSSDYFAPVRWVIHEEDDPSSPSARDAFQDPGFLDWLTSGFVDARSKSVPGGHMRWVSGSGSMVVPAAEGSGHVLGGEQSNTSVRIGDEAILKVFRRVEPGINPDPEILSFLTSHSHYRHAPAHLGTIELQRDGRSEPIVIGALQAFIPNNGDAWTWLLHSLRGADAGLIEQLLPEIAVLAQRTADLHLALAAGSDDPAFSVERIDASYSERLRQRLAAELRRTCDALRAGGFRGEDQLVELEHRLAGMLATDGVLAGLALARVHGDFHLGQVLKTTDDFVIIDFEGEPSRPFHERREKASPLKDVAGMLRSLDYAVATASAAESDGGRKEQLTGFGQGARQEFTRVYRESVAGAANELAPVNGNDFTAALSIFLIEKALYEVRYELDNRPDWVGIPLSALEQLASD